MLTVKRHSGAMRSVAAVIAALRAGAPELLPLEVESSPCHPGSMKNRSNNRRECSARRIAVAAFGLLMLISVAHAAEWAHFDSPDERAATILDNLLREELTRPGSFYEYGPEAAKQAQTAWVRVTDAEPPFLFVMLQGDYCGSGGCAIYGFRYIKDRWQRVYFHAGGEGIYLLDTFTKLHRDIRQYEQIGAGQAIESISRWDGSAYREAERRSAN
jgi:hypothetical protein